MCWVNIISLRLKSTKKVKQINFKRKKFFNTIGLKFCFGDKGLFSKMQFRIEKIHIKIIRKLIKKRYRKKVKKIRVYNKYWIRFSQNLFLTKKSKNARMGSGRGRYIRSAFVLKTNSSFIEFKNYDYYFLGWIKKRIYYKLNIFFFILIKNFKFCKIT